MRVQRKRYLRMNIQLVSSLSIGSGANDNTDHDILVNANGDPYIPGSAVAGVTRHALMEAGQLSEAEEQAVFGNVVIRSDHGEPTPDDQTESRIITYDVPLTPQDGQFYVTTRDMVALDEYKTALTGAKFDLEALEPGTVGTVIIEENADQPMDKDPLQLIAQIWNSGKIRFGAKTTRGYGAIKATAFYLAEFDLSNPEEVKRWLAFSAFDATSAEWLAWENIGKIETKETQLRLQLELVGGLSIRKYTTDVCPQGSAPDYAQMVDHAGYAVIPGTSWAGAFRHAIEQMVGKETTAGYFGNVSKDSKSKADIYFSESIVDGGSDKEFSRSAINRFTGGSADKALYTERVHYGGETVLTITLRKNEVQDKERFLKALAAAVVDLHEGILAVGGETSIGRGLFHVTAVNEQPAAEDVAGLYAQVRKALGEEAQG